MKKKYYVWAPPFVTHSGGVMALHRLVHNLTLLGEEAYLLTHGVNPKYLTKSLDSSKYSDLQSDEAVLVYPEIIFGNPFGAKNVVRWILNTPGVMGGDGVYDDRDLIFKFMDYFTVDSKYRVAGFLTAYDGRLDFWRDLGLKRSGTCFLVRKGHSERLDQHPVGAIKIDDFEKFGDDFLLQIFNLCETLICYDQSTFVNVIAALCGCLPVVIPKEGVAREEWYEKVPFYKNGIAYGYDDVTRAVETRQDLRRYISALEAKSLHEAITMVKTCESYFN